MRSVSALVCLIATVMLAPSAEGQGVETYLEMLRSDVRTQRVAIITEVMQFDEEQSAAFWPIYREYEVELGKLGDQRLALLKDYAKNYDNMTDEIAKDLMARAFKLTESRLKVRKSYFKKFEKAVSTIDAARLMQVDNQINLLIDLQIASEVPLIDRTGPATGSR